MTSTTETAALHKTRASKDRRETDHYKIQYVHEFVRKWDELIDWDARAESEGDFFIRMLRERGAKRVLDLATGTGFHSVQLLKAGFEVVSVDGSPEMLAQAFENGRRHGHILRTVCADWRWLCRDIHAKFDAAVCLGNSFTHLFTERDRRKVLAEFYSVLKHDGVLIIDQRNYDAILNDGFSCKHIYYYCGENVKAEPEYVDDGLAKFRYEFPDGSEYHLNMFPIRRESMRGLMEQVGFSRIKTFGDFKETYRENEPDFFVHAAEKLYDLPESKQRIDEIHEYDETVETARGYYNSDDADHFYSLVWGGQDIHIGLYDSDDVTIRDASQQTVMRMAERIEGLDATKHVVDLGSGYAGSARYLAKTYGCTVGALNLSERQNERARRLNHKEQLSLLVNVIDGSFEQIPMPFESADMVWSQDAILHSGQRARVFEEVNRVLKPGGQFILTDPMSQPDADPVKLQPILDRIQLSSMGNVEKYRKFAKALGWEEIAWEDLTEHLVRHYSRVRDTIDEKYDFLLEHCSEDYLSKMKTGLGHWIDGGNSGLLQWGILHFRKPTA